MQLFNSIDLALLPDSRTALGFCAERHLVGCLGGRWLSGGRGHPNARATLWTQSNRIYCGLPMLLGATSHMSVVIFGFSSVYGA